MKTINGDLSRNPVMTESSVPSSRVRDDNPADETEISIFDAQRYFSDTTADPRLCKRVSPIIVSNLDTFPDRLSVSRFSSASSADGNGRSYRPRSFHATPTASSEVSWNSQAGLLSNPPGATVISMQNPSAERKKKSGSSVKSWIFRRRCPCSGKKSVLVEDKLAAPRTSAASVLHNRVNGCLNLNQKQQSPNSADKCLGTTNWGDRREMISNPHRISAEILLPSRVVASTRPLSDTAGFTFPILNQSSPPPRPPLKLTLNNSPPRDSLEVFQPSEERAWRKSSEIQRKLASPKSRTHTAEDDVASDASSDLFEIESFSTQPTSYPHARDSLDDAPSSRRPSVVLGPYRPPVTPPECYTPSEVSIDWSVTTAEEFDRSSVAASEADHRTSTVDGGNVAKKRGNGSLLSCRCEKAVSIGPHPVKCVVPGGEGPATTTLRHVGGLNKPPLGRLSVPLAAK
ncbi:hypothetical protein SLA2020_149750 [Shorea laevis]